MLEPRWSQTTWRSSGCKRSETSWFVPWWGSTVKLEATGQERDAAVRLFEEMEEQARSVQGSLESKIFLLLPSICWIF
jgi:hypothetical protein